MPARPAPVASIRGPALADLLGPGLAVVFVGINPGLLSAQRGLHFARRANRFWRVLHAAGFTDRVWDPAEQAGLPALGIGITNLVSRPTARADELSAAELREGGAALGSLLAPLRPRQVAVLGLSAFRTAYGAQSAPHPGRVEPPAPLRWAEGVWALPNPSGLNAGYPLPRLVQLYRPLYEAAYGRPAPG